MHWVQMHLTALQCRSIQKIKSYAYSIVLEQSLIQSPRTFYALDLPLSTVILLTLLALRPTVQWAAVSTCLELMMDPPHKPPLTSNPTCQGYSCFSVSTPPTMRLEVLAFPQVQVARESTKI